MRLKLAEKTFLLPESTQFIADGLLVSLSPVERVANNSIGRCDGVIQMLLELAACSAKGLVDAAQQRPT